MDKLKILVCCHKPDPAIRTEAPYLPVQLGKANHPELDLGFATDDTGDNISDRDGSWSELTGIYWGWKNLKDVEYLGVCHYRRYFKLDFRKQDIDKLLQGRDMIVAKRHKQLSKAERLKNLVYFTSLEDTYLFIDTVLSLYPDIEPTVIRYFCNSRASYSHNMFIARKETYDAYCAFMFPILFELEKRLKNCGYWRTKRAMGYFGEWCLGLFIFYKNLKVRRVPITNWEGRTKMQTLLINLRYAIWRPLYAIADLFIPVPPRIKVPYYVLVGYRNDGIALRALKME